MAISSWKKVISDKPTIYTENKNETYIDWFLVDHPQSWESTSGKRLTWPPRSLPASRPLKSSKMWAKGLASEKADVQCLMAMKIFLFLLQYSFIKDRKSPKTWTFLSWPRFLPRPRSVFEYCQGGGWPMVEIPLARKVRLSSNGSNDSTVQRLSDLRKAIHVPTP